MAERLKNASRLDGGELAPGLGQGSVGIRVGETVNNPATYRTRRVVPVCGNTYRMLHESRFRRHFDFAGDFSRHFGLFPGCGMAMPFEAGVPGLGTAPVSEGEPSTGASCC